MWSRNAAADIGAKIPEWGFASSPLIVNDKVIVAAAGSIVAYDLATGKPRWFGPKGGNGYSSPHLFTIHGVRQILFSSQTNVTSFAPANGNVLWKHSWSGDPIVQPALIKGGYLLLGDPSAKGGIHRMTISHGSRGWEIEKGWRSGWLKPMFNDFVVHKGHAIGFNGLRLVCIDLKDGKRKWKGERYGGQLVLLADQDLLLVLSEKGEIALVKAAPDEFTELAKLPAITGKTWNHPVLAGNILVVRNTREMAAFRLPLERTKRVALSTDH